MRPTIFLRYVVCLTVCTSSATYANSPMLTDAAGRAIGYFLGSEYCQGGDFIAAMSANGYYACFRSDIGVIDAQVRTLTEGVAIVPTVYFQTGDCTGQRFLSPSGNQHFEGGQVVASTYNGLLYSLLDAQSESLVMASYGTPGAACGIGPSGASNYIASYPNVPAVTGFSSVPYAGPLTVHVLPDSALDDEIFFDMFDSVYQVGQ